MSLTHNPDRIVYLVVSAPGGVDGNDHNDKGGTLHGAYFEKSQAQGRVGADPRLKLEAKVVDVEEHKKAAMAKLDALDRLILFPPEVALKRERPPASLLPPP